MKKTSSVAAKQITHNFNSLSSSKCSATLINYHCTVLLNANKITIFEVELIA